MGSAYMQLGEWSKAVKLCEKERLRNCRRIEDVQGAGNALANMGFACARMGGKEKASKCFRESKGIFEGLGLWHIVERINGGEKGRP